MDFKHKALDVLVRAINTFCQTSSSNLFAQAATGGATMEFILVQMAFVFCACIFQHVPELLKAAMNPEQSAPIQINLSKEDENQ